MIPTAEDNPALLMIGWGTLLENREEHEDKQGDEDSAHTTRIFLSFILSVISFLSAYELVGDGVQDHGCVVGGEELRVRGEIEGILCCFCSGAIMFMSPECGGCWVVLLFLLFFCFAFLGYVISLCSHVRGMGRAR
jgi:hypothetical protein